MSRSLLDKCMFRSSHGLGTLLRSTHVTSLFAVVSGFIALMSGCCDEEEALWTRLCPTAHLVTLLLTLSEGLLFPSLGH